MNNNYITYSNNHSVYEHLEAFTKICKCYEIGTCIFRDDDKKFVPIVVYNGVRQYGIKFDTFEKAFGDMIAFIGDKISQGDKEYDINLIKYLDEISNKFKSTE